MKSALVVMVALAVTVALMAVGTASAQAPPCNDANSDGSPSGQEYAQHHIRPLANAGALGAGGHKPGSHHGFSLCDPAG